MIDEKNQYGTKKRQFELLKMIEDVDKILQTHEIKYSLYAGTLLGAVREKGFIPWDDDIDIIVDRNNFEKMIQVFNLENNEYIMNEYLWIRRIQRRNDSKVGLMKATIDVFVADNSPDNIFIRKIKLLLIMLLQGMMKSDKTEKHVSFIYRICLIVTGVLGKFFTTKFKLKLYDLVSKIGNKKPTKYLGIYNQLFKYLGLRYKRSMLSEHMLVGFENIKLPIITEYDYYLKLMYGDYMTPPAEEDRKPLHL